MVYIFFHNNNNNNSILKQTYFMQNEDFENNNLYNGLNWAGKLKKQILDEIGMSNIWQMQDIVHILIYPIRQ